MHHANLAWITERDLKNYYVLRSTHRGACYELEYPLRGWPESFLSSNWFVACF
ncbi:hypothetical protein GLAREA_11721 [Glarea lozoyensis ATCC 20868]|uniref:Uncharacterized protein n=1 Tax=Glarea lozoyensis (strain ATCC 20868 / MF5171) TaxID=1116229 RepID=S3CGY2_GLAL2|nr:uncharacterized protein GLAREA_11721 [Glarea lozoyensis ATCC 20868]EPE25140.1 hypothetical protein GLAREA_11721 [Glarea lozoyensis ATCC 20868]